MSRRILLTAFLALGSPWICTAQDPRPNSGVALESRTLEPVQLPYQLRGSEVPSYFIVKNFLFGINPRSESSFYLQRLQALGIVKDSAAEDALIHAVAKVKAILFGPEGPIVVEEVIDEGDAEGRGRTTNVIHYGQGIPMERVEEPSPEELIEIRTREANELADIYCDLLDALQNNGVDLKTFREYIVRNVIPNATLSTDEPPESIQPFLAFEAKVAERGHQSPTVEEKEGCE